MDHSGAMGSISIPRDILIPSMSMTSLDDRDLRFVRSYVMLNANKMWMRDMRSVIMDFARMVMYLEMERLRMWWRNRGVLGDVVRMVDLWSLEGNKILY